MSENNKIKRDTYLDELSNKIKEIKTYMVQTPDPQSVNRVEAQENNPYVSGNYYLNAIYKNVQTENSESAAADSAEFKDETQLYTETFIEGFIIIDSGLFKPDKVVGVFNSINDLNNKIDEYLEKNIDINAYLNYDLLLDTLKSSKESAYNNSTKSKDTNTEDIPITIFEIELDSIYQGCLEDTIKFLDKVENPSLIEARN